MYIVYDYVVYTIPIQFNSVLSRLACQSAFVSYIIYFSVIRSLNLVPFISKVPSSQSCLIRHAFCYPFDLRYIRGLLHDNIVTLFPHNECPICVYVAVSRHVGDAAEFNTHYSSYYRSFYLVFCTCFAPKLISK